MILKMLLTLFISFLMSPRGAPIEPLQFYRNFTGAWELRRSSMLTPHPLEMSKMFVDLLLRMVPLGELYLRQR